MPAFHLRGVEYRYPRSGRSAVADIDLELPQGAFTAVIGPNGAGKSTLVRLLGGALSPGRGSVEVLERDLPSWDRIELARHLAIVSQDAPPSALPIGVRGYVELGRNPYASPWAPLGRHDREIVDRAVDWASLSALETRSLADLSGGERQRAKLARALAQEPDLLVLDEPSAHLDFRHALWIFEALRGLVRDRGVTVICITHDMHLASRYADRLVLLSRGRVRSSGAAAEVLTPAMLGSAYGCEVRVEAPEGLGRIVLPVASEPTEGLAP